MRAWKSPLFFGMIAFLVLTISPDIRAPKALATTLKDGGHAEDYSIMPSGLSNSLWPQCILNRINDSLQTANEIVHTANSIDTYSLHIQSLKQKGSLGKGVGLYEDALGLEWYVRYADQTGFKQIANVVASCIHNAIATQNASNVNVKFLIASDAQGQPYLAGSASQRKDFKPLWSQNPVQFKSTQPSNLNEEYAFWHYLGMPSANPNFLGFDLEEENVVRVDFFTAFSQSKANMKVADCFKSTVSEVSHYSCDAAKVNEHFIRIASDPRVSQTLHESLAVLKMLGVDGAQSQFNKIMLFLGQIIR